MAKNSKKRAIIYSNVKENKKRAEEVYKVRENQINLNEEIVIGLNRLPTDKVKNKKKNINNKNKKSNNKQINQKNSVNKSKNVSNNKRKINYKIKKKIIGIAILISIIVIIVVGLIMFFRSPIFNIKEVNVKIQNNKILTESRIKDLAQINVGQNMYSISKKKITESIKTDSYVESVEIKRVLPDKVEINIEERTVKFQLQQDGQYIYIDNQGYILQKSAQKNDCIIITGYATTELNDGNRLNKEDLQKLSTVMQILQEADNNGIKDSITSINIDDKNNYKIYFDNLGKMAHLGDMT